MQECARVILISPRVRVLLMRTRVWDGDLWVTPGGRIHNGEDARTAALREMHEETGLKGIDLGPELWIREWEFEKQDGQRAPQREHFFLVRHREFDPTEYGMGQDERNVHQEYRWWGISDIETSGQRFAPPQIADLMRDLEREGPPRTPVLLVG